MASWASVFTFASLFLVLPAFLIFLAIRFFGSKGETGTSASTETRGEVSFAATGFVATGFVAGLAVALIVYGAIGDRVSSDLFHVGVPPLVLVLLLVVMSREPHRPASALFSWALAGTLGVGSYFVCAALFSDNDGTALWGIGILYSWVVCGLPLFVAAGVLALLRSREG